MPWPLLAILLLLPTLALAVPSKHVLIGKVVKVTDGDTITVLTADDVQERIRLWGIDAPEQRGAQPFWKASRDQLAALVAGKAVTVTWNTRDRNGRIIGWVMVDEGIWVNKVMVLTGYAWRDLHAELFKDVHHGAHLVTKRSNHQIQKTEPLLVVWAVRQTATAVRLEKEKK